MVERVVRGVNGPDEVVHGHDKLAGGSGHLFEMSTGARWVGLQIMGYPLTLS
jgi:hypothetical protein